MRVPRADLLEFILECTVGFHGKECQLTCDYCNKTSPGCRQSDGHCLHGCETRLNLPICEGLYL